MKKLLYLTIFIFGLFLMVNDAHAGIIIRPVFHTGLVGYWDFQEGAGSTANDKSGYDNDGDLTNMEEGDWINGKIGQGLDFDGTNDYISISADPTIDFKDKTDIFIGAWINPDSYGEDNYGRIFEKGDSYFRVQRSNDAAFFISNFETGDLSEWDNFDENGDSTIAADGDAKHLGAYGSKVVLAGADATVDEATFSDQTEIYMRFYVNFQAGFSMGSGERYYLSETFRDDWTWSNGVSLYYDGTHYYIFAILQDDNSSWITLPGYQASGYEFDSEMDGNWHSIEVHYKAGSGADGIIELFVDGIDVANGTDNYDTDEQRVGIVYLGGSNVEANTAGTVYIDDVVFDTSYIGPIESVKLSCNIDLATTDAVASTSTVVNVNEWHYVACLWNNSTSDVSIFIDGAEAALDASTTGSGAPVDDSGSTMYIGGDNGDSSFDGKIDEVRIYNRALSAGEVERLYKLSQPKIVAPTRTGLVGYWPFEEGTGTKAGDHSGNGNDGTISGATWVTGKLGTGLNFDSNGEVVTVTQNSIDGDQGTIMFWYKPTYAYNDSNGHFMVARYTGANSNDFWIDKWSTNDMNFEIAWDGGGGSRYLARIEGTTGNDLADHWTQNQWMHIAATWDSNASSNTMNIYINSVRPTQSSAGGPWANSWVPPTTIYIGNDGENGNIDPADGIIDEVRIYDRALEVSEIEALYKSGRAKINASQNDKLTDGLVGLWSFNGPDIDGNEAWDRSGQGNHGTLSGDPTPTIGRIGQALEFDGSSDYLDLGADTSLQMSGTVTITAWIKPDTDTITTWLRILCGNDDWVPNGYCMTHRPSDDILIGCYGTEDDDQTTFYSPSSSITEDEWNFVAMTYGASTMALYIDGVSQTLTAAGSTWYCTFNDAEVTIGAQNFSGTVQRYFNGKIDEVRIYNRTLSAQEIQRLYNMGR